MRAPLVLKVHGFRKTWLREQHGGSGCTNACLSPWLMSHCALVQHSRDNGADLNTLEHANYKLVERHATFGQNWWSIQTSTAMQISLWWRLRFLPSPRQKPIACSLVRYPPQNLQAEFSRRNLWPAHCKSAHKQTQLCTHGLLHRDLHNYRPCKIFWGPGTGVSWRQKMVVGRVNKRTITWLYDLDTKHKGWQCSIDVIRERFL